MASAAMMQQFFAAMMGGMGAGNMGGEVSWKQKLHEAVAKKQGDASKPGEGVTYTVEEEGPRAWVATASAPAIFSAEYKGDAKESKKAAEQAAAKAALEAEFPEAYEQLANMGSMAQWFGEMSGGGKGKGTKRKASGEKKEMDQHSKCQLSHGMSLLLGRTVTKEDIVYTTEQKGEAPSATYTSTLKLPAYDAKFVAKGASGSTTKEAETNAATAALTKLQAKLKPLLEEHEAKKAAKKKETLEKLKETHAAKKAAAKAAA